MSVVPWRNNIVPWRSCVALWARQHRRFGGKHSAPFPNVGRLKLIFLLNVNVQRQRKALNCDEMVCNLISDAVKASFDCLTSWPPAAGAKGSNFGSRHLSFHLSSLALMVMQQVQGVKGLALCHAHNAPLVRHNVCQSLLICSWHINLWGDLTQHGGGPGPL